MNKLFSKFLMGVISLTMAMSFLSVVHAEDEQGPVAIVKKASDQMLAALKQHKAELKTDPKEIYALVDKILLPHFDFRKMSKLALGKAWRGATDEQKDEFTKQFRQLLVRTYSTAMLEYTDQTIKVLPLQGDLSRGRVNVEMEVEQATGQPIPMTLSMYKNKESGEWLAYDVKIDSASLVTTYRSSFNDEVNKSGMDGLIKQLTEQNNKVK